MSYKKYPTADILFSKSVPLYTSKPLVVPKRSRGVKTPIVLHIDSPIQEDPSFRKINKSDKEFKLITQKLFDMFHYAFSKTDSDLLRNTVSKDILENLFNTNGFTINLFRKMIYMVSQSNIDENTYLVKFKFIVKTNKKDIVIYPQHIIALEAEINPDDMITDPSLMVAGKTRRRNYKGSKGRRSQNTRTKRVK